LSNSEHTVGVACAALLVVVLLVLVFEVVLEVVGVKAGSANELEIVEDSA